MSKRRQPQRLPPPIMHGSEAIDSEIVLREFEGELGMVLWKTVRSVRLWAELPESERPHAFGPKAHELRLGRLNGAGIPDAIARPLGRAAAVLQPRARAATVARACRDIAEWAAESGELGTAIEFMQSAAVLLPSDPELAHEVARLARTQTDYTRADTWYRQAISRARRARQWHEFARAYIGLGKVCFLKGSYPQARKNLVRGLRAAKRFSIRPLVAAAYHELMAVAIHTDAPADVTRYAHHALNAYGPQHARLPALAFDYGVFLLSSGHFAEALRTFRSVTPEFGSPSDRLMRTAAIAQAAGAARIPEIYHDAMAASETLLSDLATAPAAATALVSMARGAKAFGDFEKATQVATEARRIASVRREAANEFSADELMDELSSIGVPLPVVTARPAPSPIQEVVSEIESELRAAGHKAPTALVG